VDFRRFLGTKRIGLPEEHFNFRGVIDEGGRSRLSTSAVLAKRLGTSGAGIEGIGGSAPLSDVFYRFRL